MTITLDKSTQRRLEAKAKNEGRDLEEVAAQLLTVTLARNPEPTREDELLRLISEGLPEPVWNRKAALDERAETFMLTPEEIEKRQALMTKMEQWQVARLEAVIELAELRGETPHQVMKSLGILPR
ncbi:MAG: hypothetical protein QM758_15365 [Armatimonas sp.]